MYFVSSISIEHFKFGFPFSASVDLKKALAVCRTTLSYCIDHKQLQLSIILWFQNICEENQIFILNI